MPDFVRHVVEGRVTIDLGFRRLEHHALFGWVRCRDCVRRHHPDRQTLAAAGVDIARGLQCERRVAGVQRADMLVREPVTAADKNFPERSVRRGHYYLPEYYAACDAARCLRFAA